MVCCVTRTGTLDRPIANIPLDLTTTTSKKMTNLNLMKIYTVGRILDNLYLKF